MSGALLAASMVRLGVEYTLSGTTGSPNVANDNQTSPTNAECGWIFNTDGTVDKDDNGSISQWQDGIEYTSEQDVPTVDLWIRATNDAGDDPTTGPALTTWHKLTLSGASQRIWRWTEITNGFASTAGTLKIEISTDSGGTDIVATGYYRGVSSVEL